MNDKAGSQDGFSYSPAMADAGFVWSKDQLDKYLQSPRAVVPGTKMAYAGLANADARAEIIAFLESLE